MTLATDLRHLVLHFTKGSAWASGSIPIYVRGEGCHLWDDAGRRYLDGLAGLFVVQIGHGRSDIAQAAAKQMEQLAYTPSWGAAHPSALEAAKLIAGLAPGDLDAVFFVSSGSEAVESAIKFARQYHRSQGRPDKTGVISRNRAFTLAMAERGPVQVNIPRDLFYGEADYDIQDPLIIERSAGASNSLDKAAEALANAEFPVILAGGGVVMADGTAPLMALAEYLKAPVVNSYLHNDSFPASHELACGPLGYQGSKAAMRIVSQADVILALGSRLGPFGTLPQHGIEYWPDDAKVIQVDIDHRMLGLVQEVEVAIHGDAGAAAYEILLRLQSKDEIKAHASADRRLAEVADQKKAWAEELAEWSASDSLPMAPRRALRELEKAMPDGAMVTTDIGNICSVSNSYLNFDRPNSLFAAMMWGNCGYAFPTAMGAKIAAPDRPAIAYIGDGAWGMSMAEIMTCVRERIPVTAVVFNNGQWGAEKKNQIDFYDDRYVGTELENPSFANISRAMGGNGIQVSSPDEIGDALREASGSEKPTVLELMVSQELGEPFRRDALNVPRRMLDKYEKYGAAVGS